MELDYFKVLNMPLIKGRLLTESDILHSERVMVINDIMARTHWPNEDPIGKVITYRSDTPLHVRIVGIVKSTKIRSLTEGQRPIAYWPLAQVPRFTPSLLIRTTGNPQPLIPLIRKEATALHISEIFHISTVAQRINKLLYPQRAITGLLNGFALAGLLLCITGIYSILTYTVKQRTREIGIRLALGAQKQQIKNRILARGSILTLLGIGCGIGLSLIAIRLLELVLPGLQRWDKFMLYGINLWSPLPFAYVSLLVAAIALLACYLPARRAARIDPMEALRYE